MDYRRFNIEGIVRSGYQIQADFRRLVIVGLVVCLVGLAVGILIGHFGIHKDVQSDSANIPEYQKSCNADCAKKAKAAKSCSLPLPRYYVAHHLNGKTITVDGKLDDEAWKEVPWTDNFVDVRGHHFPGSPVETKAKIRWDDEMVYVGAYMEETKVWATFVKKDSHVYLENSFEVYFDVDKSMMMYKQANINALGTIFDIKLNRAYMDGGNMADWDGIQQKGVYTDGEVNNITSNATFWSMEMSFPFVKLNENTSRTDITAEDGEWWFFNLARVIYDLEALPNGTYAKVNNSDPLWLSWNPAGAINNHLPSKWGLLVFETDNADSNQASFKTKRWLTYRSLFDVYNALQSFKTQRGTYVDILSELDLPPYITSGSCLGSVTIKLSREGFTVTIESKKEPGVKGQITEDKKVTFSES